MKTIKIAMSIFLTFSMLSAVAQNTSYSSIAERMVNTSVQVQPGETVLISGTNSELALMEELYVEVSKAGGKPRIELTIPTANKRAIQNTPEEYLEIPDIHSMIQMKSIDCFISVGSVSDPNLFNDVSEEKIAAMRKSSQLIGKIYQTAKFRSVSLGQVGGIPTKAYAESIGVDYEEMVEMFWDAVNTDYHTLMTLSEKFLSQFKSGSTVKITSYIGTDLSFKIGDSTPGTSCGKISSNRQNAGPASTWLPAGEVYVTIDPYSANGTLVVPFTKYRDTEIRNLKITFVNGKISSMNADGHLDGLKKAIELSSGMKDMLSYIDVGLNPNSRPLNNDEYLSYEMAGVIALGIGSNSWAGGTVDSDFGLAFFIPNTTLVIEGVELLTEGELQ